MEQVPDLYKLGLIILVVLVVGLLLSAIRQPRVAGYLVVGILVGPQVFGLSPSHEVAEFVGAMGVVFLLFFVGMEVSVERLIRGWRICVLGTLLQVALSIAFAWLVSLWYGGWTLGDIILTGFVISLSSTAVVLTMLHNWKELDTRVGQDVLGILLVQDLIVVPMLIVIGFFGGEQATVASVAKQVLGGLVICVLIGWTIVKGKIRLLPFPRLSERILQEPELELFAGLAVCLGSRRRQCCSACLKRWVRSWPEFSPRQPG